MQGYFICISVLKWGTGYIVPPLWSRPHPALLHIAVDTALEEAPEEAVGRSPFASMPTCVVSSACEPRHVQSLPLFMFIFCVLFRCLRWHPSDVPEVQRRRNMNRCLGDLLKVLKN